MAERGQIGFSWFSLSGQGSELPSVALFTLRFRTLAPITDWAAELNIDPTNLWPEAYRADEFSPLLPSLNLQTTVSNPSVVTASSSALTPFSVGQNFPNPFSLLTQIPLTLPEPATVQLTVTDALGRQVLQRNQEFGAGEHLLTVELPQHHSGLYYYRVQAGHEVVRRPFLLQR
ncbi:MAG: T9SS type A sorting domain-containing protein [Lewinella sp.]|nr:T9SS type A sorting domain-containing protein [Lewinella sp.]